MGSFLVSPIPSNSCASYNASGIDFISKALRPVYPGLAATSGILAAPSWTTTTPPYCRPALQLIGPGEQSENEEEDADDLELENDEDHSKLRLARAQPTAEDGSTAARGDDGTINPPFP
ncbi:hypothetical protein GCM10022409_24910 [Hymenobacter glaciei]|uniref:Uncharacterized protein n=1 Tax=Hymenobacter glaciei TaxID=877209 RepID=A0ABP7U9E6_9BACT